MGGGATALAPHPPAEVTVRAEETGEAEGWVLAAETGEITLRRRSGRNTGIAPHGVMAHLSHRVVATDGKQCNVRDGAEHRNVEPDAIGDHEQAIHRIHP